MKNDIVKILKKNFGGQVFDYPLKSYEGQSYFKTLRTKLALFENKISQLPTSFELFENIKKEIDQVELLNQKLVNVLSNYLWGSQSGANKHFELLIESNFVKNKLLSFSEELNNSKSNVNRLFRIRHSETELLERNQLFHIPFKDRHLVANQRYSIAGLPCLYLGSSIYVCWLCNLPLTSYIQK